jgi:hypothetical protein
MSRFKQRGCHSVGTESALGWSMKTQGLTGWVTAAAVTFFATVSALAGDTRCYEMRIYTAGERLPDVHARMKNHAIALVKKHGMTPEGFWVPKENPEGKILFVLSYPTRDAREVSWKSFGADPEWLAVKEASEKNGKLVQKAENFFLHTTDYSPVFSGLKPGGDRVFELRTYTASEGNLERLNARFRNHTLALFAKHGMTNVIYWNRDQDQPEADRTLVYFLAHASQDAAKASFGAFGKDPAWVDARNASEKDGGGSLTAKGGVKSEFFVATDYSPVR